MELGQNMLALQSMQEFGKRIRDDSIKAIGTMITMVSMSNAHQSKRHLKTGFDQGSKTNVKE